MEDRQEQSEPRGMEGEEGQEERRTESTLTPRERDRDVTSSRISGVLTQVDRKVVLDARAHLEARLLHVAAVIGWVGQVQPARVRGKQTARIVPSVIH